MGIVLVGTGGIVGALLRYQLTRWASGRWLGSFPFATVVINVTGAFLLGLFTRFLGTWFPTIGMSAMLFLGTGLCGAYTTFSTFTYEFVILCRERKFSAACIYFLATNILGFAAAAAGLFGLPR